MTRSRRYRPAITAPGGGRLCLGDAIVAAASFPRKTSRVKLPKMGRRPEVHRDAKREADLITSPSKREERAMTHRGATWFSICGALLCFACGDDPSLDRTIATIELVRGESTVEDVAVERVARAAAEDNIAVAERGLARLSMDAGPLLLLDAEST